MDIRQLLAQGYQAADRFLPFDGVLDPMFAPPPRRQMPQDVGAMPNTQSRFAPQMPQGSPNMQSRFAPQQPAPMPQQMPAPVQAPRRGGNDFGRTVMEFIDPSFNRRADERSAAMAKQAQQDQFLQYAQTVLTDPREQLVFRANPEEWAKNTASRYAMVKLGKGEALNVNGENVAYNWDFMEVGPNVVSTNPDGTVNKAFTRDMTPEEALKLQQSKEPARIEGPDGIYERQTDGSWKKVAKFGAAPKVFAPQRAPGGGSGGSKLPTGYIVDAQ